MKKVILFLLTAILIVTSCSKVCKITRPKDLNPIDWNNYNDVYTVTHHSRQLCSDKDKLKELEGRKIKVAGWIVRDIDRHLMYINDNPNSSRDEEYLSIRFLFDSDSVVNIFNAKMDTSDFSKKCYFAGTLFLPCMIEKYRCSETIGFIDINNPDDVYFE
jgi:hypothetical protein